MQYKIVKQRRGTHPWPIGVIRIPETRWEAVKLFYLPRAIKLFVLVMFLIAAVHVVSLLCGCASFSRDQVSAKPLLDAAPMDANPYPKFTDAQCYRLMQTRDNWQFAAKLLGGLGGSATIMTPIPQWNDAGRWALGASAAALTVGGVASAWVGESKSKEFEEFCKVEN